MHTVRRIRIAVRRSWKRVTRCGEWKWNRYVRIVLSTRRANPAITVTTKLRVRVRDSVVIRKHLDVDKPNRPIQHSAGTWTGTRESRLPEHTWVLFDASSIAFDDRRRRKRTKPEGKFVWHLTWSSKNRKWRKCRSTKSYAFLTMAPTFRQGVTKIWIDNKGIMQISHK